VEFLKNFITVVVAIVFVAAMAGLIIGATIASGGFFFILFCVTIIYIAIRATWEHYFPPKE